MFVKLLVGLVLGGFVILAIEKSKAVLAANYPLLKVKDAVTVDPLSEQLTVATLVPVEQLIELGRVIAEGNVN